MLIFRHDTETIMLQPGETWAAPARGENYRDTAAETLHSIITEIEHGRPWREAVAACYAESQPWLHQIVTSPTRDLFFRQHPPATGSRVLDIGAGWGQIALPLARDRAAQVTALEPTPERLAFIRAAATQEGLTNRLHFIQGNFFDVEFTSQFDLVCCIGVLEWVPKFSPGEPREAQLEFLKAARTALAPGGRLVIGIENRLGLKYLMGARDDHTGQQHISVFDAGLAAAKHRAVTGQELRAFTYTLAEFWALFHDAGFAMIETYAAFPDYKLPHLVLPLTAAAEANRRLLTDSIPNEHDGIDGHLLDNTNEIHSHYRSLAALGIAHYFAPSFIFVLQ